MSEKRIEELGHLAFDKGFFIEWQDTASRYLQEERYKDRIDAYEQAYNKFSGTRWIGTTVISDTHFGMRCGTSQRKMRRETREERNLAQKIRRRMIARDHGDDKKFDKKRERRWRYED